MSYPQAIFASALVLAAAILANPIAPTVHAGGSEAGNYGVKESNAAVWRANTKTGHISHWSFELEQKYELMVKRLPWAD